MSVWTKSLTLRRNFVLHVENAFRNRGLRVDVLVLGPRIPLGAAVHRQFIEGVLAVVRLSRPNQVSRKIPLQLFDRTAGLDNVRFLGKRILCSPLHRRLAHLSFPHRLP